MESPWKLEAALTRIRKLAQVSGEVVNRRAAAAAMVTATRGEENGAAAALHPNINFRANPGVSASCPHGLA